MKKKLSKAKAVPSRGVRNLFKALLAKSEGEAVVADPDSKGALVLFRAKGRMSHFGGPEDTGMSPDEPLALFTEADLGNPKHASLFLASSPPGTTGLGRRLNPEVHYIACRWDYAVTPASLLRTAEVLVTNPTNGTSLSARPVDWGPNVKTGRVADLSPGLEKALGLKTDNLCEVVLAVAPPAGVNVPATASEPALLATGALHPPRIYACNEWGAAPAARTEFTSNRAVGIVIHHTEGANRKPLSGSMEIQTSFAMARQIQRTHMKENGWADTGQHFTISQGGIILEGRHGSLAAAANGECVQAAHAGDTIKNEQWFGIEVCGDNRKAYHVTTQQWAALVDLCAWLCDARGGEDLKIIGHKEIHDTTCPGLLMDHLDDLRQAVGARRHATSDTLERDSFFATFADFRKDLAEGLPQSAPKRLSVRAASALSAKSAAQEEVRAHFVAAKFIWRYHLDPRVRDRFNPASPDWLDAMMALRMEHTLLAPLPGTPADIASARIKTAATTLIGICLHHAGENASLEPSVSKDKALSAVADVMSDRKKTVGQLGSVLDSVVRF